MRTACAISLRRFCRRRSCRIEPLRRAYDDLVRRCLLSGGRCIISKDPVTRIRRSLRGICASSAALFGASRQLQSRIEATTREQAFHCPFLGRLLASTGFALEGLRYAKRVYENT